MRKLLPLFIVCGLAGCATTPQQAAQETNAKIDDAMSAALLPGTSTIKGQASAKTASGEVRYAAGVPIYLYPKTPYVENCMKAQPPADASCRQKLSKFRLQTTANGEGHFEYLKLKPGTYYLEATMPWGAPAKAGGTFRTQVTIETDDQTVTAVID
jgi:hypothetical protein